MRHKGFSVIVTALLGVFALLTAPALAAPMTATARHTTVVAERPVDSHGNLRAGFTVTRRVGGKRLPTATATCGFGSSAVNVAYRCFAGNYILDPCWVAHHRSTLYCQLTPWSHKVVRLHASSYDNLGYTQRGARRRLATPWGLQALGGARRAFLQGAGCTAGSKPIHYNYRGTRIGLAGNVERTAPLWRIEKVKRGNKIGCDYHADGYVSITREWIGQPSRRGATG